MSGSGRGEDINPGHQSYNDDVDVPSKNYLIYFFTRRETIGGLLAARAQSCASLTAAAVANLDVTL